MKNALIGSVLLPLSSVTDAAPVVYTSEASFLAGLAPLEGAIIHESFEDGAVWKESRNTISSPGSTPAVASQGVLWTSNYPQNNISTGTVGGSAPDSAFAIYSLPHGLTTDSGLYCDSAEDPNIPIVCYQNDGMVEQGDLDLVLLSWGAETPPIPPGLTGDPPEGQIEQNELDAVLLNWGNVPVSVDVVPEPTSVIWVLMGVGLGFLRSRRLGRTLE